VSRVEALDVEALAERLVKFVTPYQEVVGWTLVFLASPEQSSQQ